jgi:HD-GYP domain-containing protein (c-di-GMP phosphodiesterase class II)
MKIDLSRTLLALTGALDLVGVDEVHHGKRVALMADATAAQLGWNRMARRDLTFAGLLHDCGVARTREHRVMSETLEWSGAEGHCLRGEAYLAACPPLSKYRQVIRHHHTRWEDLQRMDATDELRLHANLVFLAESADVLVADHYCGDSMGSELLWQYPQAVDRLRALGGTLFCPELVEAFSEAAQRESFWLCMDSAYVDEEVALRLADADPIELDTRGALAVAGLFARTVDAKSAYTLDHSRRVAGIARLLAGRLGIAGERLDMIEIAALLHDIGKLRVPEEIIDKPAALTPQERAFVQRHSYDTTRLLSRVFPGLPIADWAGMHHENLLGTGYPEHRHGGSIPLEARLVALSDIFQAMSQERPYRGRWTATQVMQHVDELRALGRLDAEMVELLRAHLDACYAIAVE